MTPASTPYPAHRLPDGPRCKSRLCTHKRTVLIGGHHG